MIVSTGEKPIALIGSPSSYQATKYQIRREERVKINRVWAMPNKWTFTIKPIAELLARYVGDGKGWIDPFAGENSPAEFTNDLNPEMKTIYHLEAVDFCRQLNRHYSGVLFDPPYSYRQISDCYRGIGLKATQQDTQSFFYNKVMNEICDKIKVGGMAITCGWHSNGFGRRRGFELIEVLLIAHGSGSHRNDTIVTVERKIQANLGTMK